MKKMAKGWRKVVSERDYQFTESTPSTVQLKKFLEDIFFKRIPKRKEVLIRRYCLTQGYVTSSSKELNLCNSIECKNCSFLRKIMNDNELSNTQDRDATD